MSYTISQIAKKFGISRSTLLYYDSIGLISAEKRSRSNYRIYSEEDLKLMEEISLLHRTGMALSEIKKIIKKKPSLRGDSLKQRLSDISAQMHRLREQQDLILKLLGDVRVNSSRNLNKDQWVKCLRKAGLDDAGLKCWHAEFEKTSPEAHQLFLESLGITASEIQAIRKWSKRCRD